MQAHNLDQEQNFIPPVSPETAHSVDIQSLRQHVSTGLENTFLAALSLAVRGQKSLEPTITQIQNPDGEVFWAIDDPSTAETIYCTSEDEVLRWLEQTFL